MACKAGTTTGVDSGAKAKTDMTKRARWMLVFGRCTEKEVVGLAGDLQGRRGSQDVS